MTNLNQKLSDILKKDLRFIDQDGDLLKSEVIDKAWKVDPKLIELLLEDKEVKQKFFLEIKEHWVFNVAQFVVFVQDKNFLNDSYTKFKNKIGLTIDGKYLNQRGEVALAWPYKDCILEGGMSDEESGKEEVFFNEVLAQDEIDRLLDSKVLTNGKLFDVRGEKKFDRFNRNENGVIKDNLIIKGNNLLALHSLKKEFSGKVKLIYIDPPYNTGNDGFRYNDRFNHSTWLTFMKNRLEIAKELLREDGVIFVQCDDNEQAYLKVLMDDIFGRDFYLNTIAVKSKASSGASGGGEDKKIKKNIEFLTVFCKSTQFEKFNDLHAEIPFEKYLQDLKDNGKGFAYNSVLVAEGKKEYFTSTKDGRGDEIKIFKHTGYSIKSISQLAKEEDLSQYEVYKKYFKKVFTLENAQTSIRDRVLSATDKDDTFYTIEYVPISGRHKGKVTNVSFIGKTKRLVSYLKFNCIEKDEGIFKRLKIGTLWDDLSWSSVFLEGDASFSNGKKPESLIERIIDMATQEDDIVLDYHLGSGTTCAVAHKMVRQYIGIEQMEYIEDLAVKRLGNVISGEQSGISKAVEWKGGGSFIYFELKKYNEDFVSRIQSAKTTADLEKIWEEMKAKSFLNWNVDFRNADLAFEDWKQLDLEKQKHALIELLNKNQLYVNLSEIDDKTFACTDDEKKLSSEFYKS